MAGPEPTRSVSSARTRSPRGWVYASGLLLWALAFWLALHFGAARDLDWQGIAQLRLPRALLATAVGIGLAVSGAGLQALFTNPLCEPYTLGISSGAALGAVLGTSLGWQGNISGIALPGFAGALLFTSLLFLVSGRSRKDSVTILLAGVMLGFLGSSLVALWMALSDVNGIQGAVFWLMGDFSRGRLAGATWVLGGVLGLSLLVWLRAGSLDAFLLGEEAAQGLGVEVRRERKILIVLLSLLVGFCVSSSGMIGFVGLVIPHFVRRLRGPLHRELLPVCAIWGAASLTSADVLARVLVAPYEIPVGVITALVGAPLFVWIFRGRKGLA